MILPCSGLQHCIDSKDESLDLGVFGLGYDNFREGNPVAVALRKCTHLKTLTLSYSWQGADNRTKYAVIVGRKAKM